MHLHVADAVGELQLAGGEFFDFSVRFLKEEEDLLRGWVELLVLVDAPLLEDDEALEELGRMRRW